MNYILYIGLSDKDTHRQEIDTLTAYKIATRQILAYTDGATITEANGIYTHASGDIVIEKTLKIELSGVTRANVKALATDLKRLFNQESIMLQKVTATAEFI